ncbi:MAG TPA: SH3 domain-containing protein, partial [Bacillota bacterium]|nr:SH3 domain-containing protein [Bacillota bacterium]
MKRYKILFSAAAILLLIVSSLGGCTYDPARRYIQTDPNANNMAAPNTPAIPGNVVGRADNSADGNKISATYEVVDFSYITCNTNNLNVRAGAGNKFPSVGTLKSGQKIRALGKLDGWYVVKMPDSGRIGCIPSASA